MYISKTILILIALALAVSILFTCNHCSPPQVSSEKVDSLVWVNDAGDIVSSLKGSPEAFTVIDHHFADSIAKVYKTTVKNLQEYIVAFEQTNADLIPIDSTRSSDYFLPDSNHKDCPPQIKNLRQSFTNPYYTAQVQIGDSSFMHLQAFDTLTVVWKQINEGNIFNRRHFLQLDVSTANPDTKIYGLKAYRVYEKPKKWAIGIQAGYGFNFKGASAPYIGIGITKTVIRF